MASKRVSKQTGEAADQPTASALRHVLVVGGTTVEWDALNAELWASRRKDLAKVVAHAGATWLTIRPYAAGSVGGASHTERVIDVCEGCTVIVDPSPDGRARLLAAIDQLRHIASDAVDEAAIAGVLMAPAPVEPDLTVVLGTSLQLPSSLVWELAYSEIVYIETHWNDLAAVHVEHAIDEYSRRHRRFGGIER